MTATIHLDNSMERNLSEVSKIVHKQKEEIIKEAIALYIENVKKHKLLNAIEKTKIADKELFNEFEDTIDDNL